MSQKYAENYMVYVYQMCVLKQLFGFPAQPDHDPNTQHVLCGADADLIMLGLATHEPNFTIIREEFKPNKPRPCDVCGQIGKHVIWQKKKCLSKSYKYCNPNIFLNIKLRLYLLKFNNYKT